MNEKESIIYQLIKEDPFISQNDLASKTGLSRSAVAGYISSLTKQGNLLGRAYILPKKNDVLCVGGANIDRKIQVLDQLQYGTSNPASSTQSCGGVARNISENLGRLGCQTALLTVVGDDKEGEWLTDSTSSFVDMTPSQILSATTGTYTAILDEQGEMAVALADMYIYDTVTEESIEKRWGYFASAEMIVLDTNFPDNVLRQIINRCREENIPLCITPVSSPKIKKLPESLKGVTWLICNKDEAEALTNLKIESEEDYSEAAKHILGKGVQKVIITRGSKGIIYSTIIGETGTITPPKTDVVDVTGAGDSLVSGVIFAHLKGFSTEDACKFGVTCSSMTIQTSDTVSPNLNDQKLQDAYNQFFSKENDIC